MRPPKKLAFWLFCISFGCATPPNDAPSAQNPNQPPPTHDANSNPDEGQGIGTCTEGQTQECCGDSVCDGPETPENCPTDCPVTASGDENPSENLENETGTGNEPKEVSEPGVESNEPPRTDAEPANPEGNP